jgi:hypothetical protein
MSTNILLDGLIELAEREKNCGNWNVEKGEMKDSTPTLPLSRGDLRDCFKVIIPFGDQETNSIKSFVSAEVTLGLEDYPNIIDGMLTLKDTFSGSFFTISILGNNNLRIESYPFIRSMKEFGRGFNGRRTDIMRSDGDSILLVDNFIRNDISFATITRELLITEDGKDGSITLQQIIQACYDSVSRNNGMFLNLGNFDRIKKMLP